MKISAFAEKIRELISISGKVHEAFSHIDLIMNPAAGTFKRKNTYLQRLGEIRSCMTGFLKAEGERVPDSFNVHITEYPGHAGEITRALALGEFGGTSAALRARTLTEDISRRLIITAGGDGTHLEALSALVETDKNIRDRTCIFRMPMGTGNDSADAESLREACAVLSGNFTFTRTGAVRFKPAGLPPLYAFNIGSLGLDAFVVDLTNRLKRTTIPGDVYKAMVNVATLFYKPLVGVKKMRITLLDGEKETGRLEDSFLMTVVGLSGGRTYGDHIHILPGTENICAVRNASLLRILNIKKLFYTGDHGGLPEVSFAGAGSLLIEYDGRIPLQLDGEAVWLNRENFPLRIDLLDPVINILHKRN